LESVSGAPDTEKIVGNCQSADDGAIAKRGEFDCVCGAAGSAADSDTLLLDLNGQTAAPLGAAGSSRTIVLIQKDLRQTTGGDTQR